MKQNPMSGSEVRSPYKFHRTRRNNIIIVYGAPTSILLLNSMKLISSKLKARMSDEIPRNKTPEALLQEEEEKLQPRVSGLGLTNRMSWMRKPSKEQGSDSSPATSSRNSSGVSVSHHSRTSSSEEKSDNGPSGVCRVDDLFPEEPVSKNPLKLLSRKSQRKIKTQGEEEQFSFAMAEFKTGEKADRAERKSTMQEVNKTPRVSALTRAGSFISLKLGSTEKLNLPPPQYTDAMMRLEELTQSDKCG